MGRIDIVIGERPSHILFIRKYKKYLILHLMFFLKNCIIHGEKKRVEIVKGDARNIQVCLIQNILGQV
jgi:hypothetical protein